MPMPPFRSKSTLVKLSSAIFTLVLLFSFEAQAQSKKAADKKPTVAKKAEKSTKDAKKDERKDAKSKKETASAKDKSKQTDKQKDKQTKDTDKNKNNRADLKKKDAAKEKESKKAVEARRAEEAKRRAEEIERERAEEARRQAIAAEKRRREQVAREARERAIAFERGLRTETLANIGDDNIEGEDLQIRRAAVNALGKHAGTVVVMEAQTGKVLTIVNQDWAVRNSYRPCSTIKLVTGVAGLTEDVIDSQGNVGNFRMNLDDALAYSNNVYFQKVGANIGNDKIISYALALGLGTATGINHAGETAGKLPFNNNSRLIYSHGDDFEVSPLQLAVMVSAITNGGKLVVPQVPRTRVEQTNFRGMLRRQVNLPMNHLTGVIPGMMGAASYGTARRSVDAAMGVAGKTGSCIGKGSWLGLFASVAPVQNPKYAVVVVTRGQAERGKHAAAVAGRVYEALRPRLNETGERNPALNAYKYTPQPKINAKAAARIGSEEDDEETDESEVGGDLQSKKIASEVEEINEVPVPKPVVKKGEKPSKMFPAVVIDVKKGKTETTRPRVVLNK
jgi:hypothetical protein